MKKQHNYALNEVTSFDTIKEMLEIAEREAGDKTAFKYRTGGETVEISFKRFNDETKYLGTAITNLGIVDNHIACIGENSYKWVLSYLTVLKSSSVFVPVDKELPADDIVNVLINSDSEVLFYSSTYEDMLMQNLDRLGSIKYFIGFDRDEISEDGRFISFDALLKMGKEKLEEGDQSYTSQTFDPMKLKLLVYTSGTTGLAKGVMLTEHNLVSCVYYGLQISTVYDTCLSVLPYHHTYESVAGLLVSIHMHSTICINDKIRNVLKNLQFFKPSYIYLVPAFAETFYKKIWASAKDSGREKSLKQGIKISRALRAVGIDKRKQLFKSIHDQFGGRLRKIVCGGAPIRSEIGRFFDDIGIDLISGYGITECSPLVSANRDYFNDFTTAGVKLPCIEVKIDGVNEDNNGEICVKGDTVMLGYYKNPEESERVLRDGWFYTGDYGTINEEGQITITGRKKNLIVLTNGKNIYPEEIENYILSIPYVEEVIVSAIRDDNGSEAALSAEVYLNPDKVKEIEDTEIIDQLKKDIKDQCRSLPSYKQIQKVIIRDTAFNKTTTNKIKRNYSK